MTDEPEIGPDPADDHWIDPSDRQAPTPDAVDLVVEAEAMLSVFAAHRYERIEGMRRELLADAERHGLPLTEVLERSVRLELAAALRVTEAAAGRLIGEAHALVHRYPAALDSLAAAGMTHRHAVILVEALDAVEPVFHDRLLGAAVALAESQPVGTFCKGHHVVKHHGGWCVQQIEGSGGAMLWTSPTGRQYRVDPERRVPVFTPADTDTDDAAPF